VTRRPPLLPLGLCGDCGMPTPQIIELEFPDGVVVDVRLCEPCRATSYGELAELNRQLQFLLANGVPKSRADAIMCRRVDEMFAKRSS